MFCTRMIFIFVFTSIVGGVFGRTMLYKSVGEVCKSGPDPWICKTRENCSTLKKTIEKGVRPDICSFLGNQAVFCCPHENEFFSSGSTSGPQPSASTKKPSAQSIDEENNEKRSKSSPGSKAEEMCGVYSKYVYQNVTIAPMLPGQKPRIISLQECSIETLIVGGVDAKTKEFPHMALIGFEENKRKKIEWVCGGSLISPKFILSAAHCILSNSFQYWVRLGDLDTSSETEDSEPENIKVIRKIGHPQYNSNLLYHDIALFELESEAKLSTYVRPLCLHTSKEIGSEKLVASGWGHTRWQGRRSSKLQKVVLPPVSHQVCREKYGRKHQDLIPQGILEDSMLCTGSADGKDTCQGDSGGPLQIKRKNIFCMYSIVGIVSYGKGCALGYPSIYTRVSNYVPWIENIVWP